MRAWEALVDDRERRDLNVVHFEPVRRALRANEIARVRAADSNAADRLRLLHEVDRVVEAIERRGSIPHLEHIRESSSRARSRAHEKAKAA